MSESRVFVFEVRKCRLVHAIVHRSLEVLCVLVAVICVCVGDAKCRNRSYFLGLPFHYIPVHSIPFKLHDEPPGLTL